MTRTAIYVRLSRDREGSGLGVARQREDCEAQAQRMGWTVSRVLTDNDLSASSGKPRPGYAALLDGLRDGTYDAVIAWHPDRLHRAPIELEEFIGVVEERGAKVSTVKAGDFDLSTSTGRQTARIIGAIARGEVERQSERIKRKQDQLAAQGLPKGGSRAYGYGSNGMDLIPEEADVIRDAARRVLAGNSLTSVCRDLNSRGLTTTRGAQWVAQNLSRMLRSPRYAGLRQHKGEVVGAAAWPSVYDVQTYERLNALFDDPSRNSRTNPRRNVLLGILACSFCGESLGSGTRDGDSYYACFTGYRVGDERDRCGKVRIKASAVDQWVCELAHAVLRSPLLAEMMAGEPDVDTSGATEELETIRAKRQETAQAYAEGTLSLALMAQLEAQLAAREDAARKTLAQRRQSAVLAPLADPDTLADRWEGLDVSAKSAVLKLLFPAISVRKSKPGVRFHPSRLRVAWRDRPDYEAQDGRYDLRAALAEATDPAAREMALRRSWGLPAQVEDPDTLTRVAGALR